MNKELALAYRMQGATIGGEFGTILEATDLSIRDHAVTVIVGPAGVGKSQLLRALSGRAPRSGWEVGGKWIHRDRELTGAGDDVAWFDQKPRSEPALGRDDLWRETFDVGARTVLLDEPERGLGEEARGHLVERLGAHRLRGAAVVVTHDLAFAESVADEVYLICAGRIRAQERVKTFFGNPRTEMTRRFTRQGNCWPDTPPPDLPPHFCWVIPGRLAGVGVPGLLGEEDADLEALVEAGITQLVSLTERPFSPKKLAGFGLEARHFPIRDMGVPALGATANLCASVATSMAGGARVAFHCKAGLGRTGTLLAAQLLWMRLAQPEDVVAKLRALGRGYVQSKAQEDFIRFFAEYSGV